MNNSYKRYWQPNYLHVMGLSAVSATLASYLTYPFEFVKTIIHHRNEGVGIRHKRSQYWGYNPHRIYRQMHELGGTKVVFKGFEAHLTARLAYLAIRNTIYFAGYEATKPAKVTNDLTMGEKARLAAFAGGVAAFLTSPLELVMIRQVLDTQIHPEWRRNYSSLTTGLNTLKSTGELWQGVRANVLRSVAVNTTLTIPYDWAHEHLYTQFGEFGFVPHISLLFAAAVSAFMTCPLDHIRTRLMQQFKDPMKNRLTYRGMGDLLVQSLEVEGVKSLWAGCSTYFGKVYLYSLLTIGLTSQVLDSLKRRAGLEDWQI